MGRVLRGKAGRHAWRTSERESGVNRSGAELNRAEGGERACERPGSGAGRVGGGLGERSRSAGRARRGETGGQCCREGRTGECGQGGAGRCKAERGCAGERAFPRQSWARQGQAGCRRGAWAGERARAETLRLGIEIGAGSEGEGGGGLRGRSQRETLRLGIEIGACSEGEG